ncbi:hypothetical protein E2C01_071986 [Portunus trituberculatus]|uniref:Uncharacterized protein n=1 Tax=Portunus trituberculatus TaxID=210409 RepID=A0A5B7I6K0_PORTR|nr:hypothetical protein [Portunus trituberculatus]
MLPAVASCPLCWKDVINNTPFVYMSGSPYKRKSEVIWSDHAYSVATEGGLGPFCQPEIGLEIENKRPCLGLSVPTATTKPAESHVDPAQRTMPVDDTAAKTTSALPAGHGKTPSELFSWFAALLKQHPDLQPLYKEGRSQPYFTDSSFYATLVSEGFLGLVMECPGEEGTHPVIIHGVATHINVNLIEVPAGFHELKRRMVGQIGKASTVGSGDREGAQYCAGPHKSVQCLNKIKEGTKIPPRRCNCGGDHNAYSTLCTVRPRPQREPATDEVSPPRLVFRQAPPPQTNAWATKPSFSAAAAHLSQPSSSTTGTLATPAVFPPLPQRTVPPKTMPQPGVTQELPATDPTQQLMTVVSALAAKVDNLSATVSGLSNEFAAFKNQQHTVCGGTPTVAPTPSPASGAQQGQGESDVCQHSVSLYHGMSSHC